MTGASLRLGSGNKINYLSHNGTDCLTILLRKILATHRLCHVTLELPRGFRVDKVAIYYAYIPSVMIIGHPLNKGNPRGPTHIF